MKFSFDSEDYRDNLAEQLKKGRETNKDAARELLKNEQETGRYQIARDIKVINTETRKILGGNGEPEATLEVDTIDISARIPEDIQLYFDTLRIENMKKLEGVTLKANFDYRAAYVYPPTLPENIPPFAIKRAEKRAEKDMQKHEGDIPENKREEVQREYFNRELSYQFSDIMAVRFREYLNEITEGVFMDPNTLCHVVGVELDDRHGEEKKKEDVRKRYPLRDEETGIYEEVPFDVMNAKSNYLWFTSGGSSYLAHGQYRGIVILCDSRNKRLQEVVSWVDAFRVPGDRDMSRLNDVIALNKLPASEMIGEATKKYATTYGGMKLEFKHEVPWVEIADLIVDLYHGRMYKIRKGDAQDLGK